MRANLIGEIETLTSKSLDGSRVPTNFKRKDSSCESAPKRRKAWGTLTDPMTLPEPILIPKGNLLVGIREHSFHELERFGIVVPGFTENQVLRVENPAYADQPHGDIEENLAWLLFSTTREKTAAAPFLLFRPLAALAYQIIEKEQGSVESLTMLAESSLFANAPAWTARMLNMHAPASSEPEDLAVHDLRLIKEAIRDLLWDVHGLWFDWFLRSRHPDDNFFFRKDVVKFLGERKVAVPEMDAFQS